MILKSDVLAFFLYKALQSEYLHCFEVNNLSH